MRHIASNLKSNQKHPFVLAVEAGRRTRLTNLELKQTKCSFVLFDSQWYDKKTNYYEWAWKVLKAWPNILKECEAAYQVNKQCKLSVSTGGTISSQNL